MEGALGFSPAVAMAMVIFGFGIHLALSANGLGPVGPPKGS